MMDSPEIFRLGSQPTEQGAVVLEPVANDTSYLAALLYKWPCERHAGFAKA